MDRLAADLPKEMSTSRNSDCLKQADPPLTGPEIGFLAALWLPETRHRAGRVALVVGTLLVLINQGDLLIAGLIPPLWKILLTYLVPYSVSSYSTAAFIASLSRRLRNHP